MLTRRRLPSAALATLSHALWRTCHAAEEAAFAGPQIARGQRASGGFEPPYLVIEIQQGACEALLNLLSHSFDGQSKEQGAGVLHKRRAYAGVLVAKPANAQASIRE
jgi:hypothetical protein